MDPEQDQAIRELLAAFGMDDTDQNVHQVLVLLEALQVYDQRSQHYGQSWKNYGALSNLLSSARKVDRLMEVWWDADADAPPVLHKDGLDDAIDLINYTVFFIRNARAGNLTGVRPVRPEPQWFMGDDTVVRVDNPGPVVGAGVDCWHGPDCSGTGPDCAPVGD
jgi:hypothetical protein